jgi:hypothetical protein
VFAASLSVVVALLVSGAARVVMVAAERWVVA